MLSRYTSANKTSSGVVKATPGGIFAVTLTAGAGAAATLILYDNPSAGSGTIIWQLAAVQGTSASAVIDAPFGVGCYMALTGTGAVGSISYW
jgi:hypothetical protein